MATTHERRIKQIFGEEKAYRQLDENGEVLTARVEDEPTEGPVWVSRSRNGEKEFNGHRTVEREALSWDAFVRYARSNHETAGFESANLWTRKVREMNDGETPTEITIYQIRKEA